MNLPVPASREIMYAIVPDGVPLKTLFCIFTLLGEVPVSLVATFKTGSIKLTVLLTLLPFTVMPVTEPNKRAICQTFWNVLLRNWMLADPSGPVLIPSPLYFVVGLEMFETVLLENVTLVHGLCPSAKRPTCVFNR